MVKLKTPPNPYKVEYEAGKVWRWNLCQKFAKIINDSEIPTDELPAFFEDIENKINSNL